MHRQRVWIISELYYPEETSTGYFLTRIAEGLASEFEVHVLCGQPSYAARGRRSLAHEERNAVSIQRCTATTFNKDILPLRLVNLLTITLSVFVQTLLRLRLHDVVLVVTNPPFLPFVVAFVCRIRGAKSLLLIHDVYPDLLIASGILHRTSLASRLGKWLNRRLYRSAERIIVLGRDMQALAVQRLDPSQCHRVVVINNWADVDQVVPSSRARNALLRELGLEDKFVVQYAGNMGYPNDLESLVECAAQLRSIPEIHFLMIGSGAKRKWLQAEIHERRLDNVTVLPSRPRSDQSNFLNACDVSIVSLVDGMLGISVPSRTYNILAAGKPLIVVAHHDSEPALLAREERVGWVVPPHHAKQLAGVILNARANPTELQEMGRRARLFAETRCNLPSVMEAYDHLIRTAVNDPKCHA